MSKKERSRFILSVLVIVVTVMCLMKVIPYKTGMPIAFAILSANFLIQAFHSRKEGVIKEFRVQLIFGILALFLAAYTMM